MSVSTGVWLRCLVKPVQYDSCKLQVWFIKTEKHALEWDTSQSQSSCLSGHDLYHSQQKCDERRLFNLSGYSIMSANGQRQDIFRQDKLLSVKVISKQNNLTSVVSEQSQCVWIIILYRFVSCALKIYREKISLCGTHWNAPDIMGKPTKRVSHLKKVNKKLWDYCSMSLSWSS